MAESNAYAALQTAVSGVDSGILGLDGRYDEQKAESYAAAIHAFATAHSSSPWAAFADAQATANATEVASDAAFYATWRQAKIDHLNTQELADALAQKVWAKAGALASAVASTAKATAVYGLAVAKAAAENLAASQGYYQGTLPTSPDLPATNVDAVDAVMATDYAAPPADARYAGFIDDLFGIPSAEPYNSIAAEELTGNTISGDTVRLMDPTQETITVGNVVECYNQMTGRYEALPEIVAAAASEDIVLSIRDGSNTATSDAPLDVKYDLKTGHFLSAVTQSSAVPVTFVSPFPSRLTLPKAATVDTLPPCYSRGMTAVRGADEPIAGRLSQSARASSCFLSADAL